MRYLYLKDIKKRKNFLKNELKIIVIKVFFINLKTKIMNSKFQYKLLQFLRNNTKIQIKNRCILTYKSKSVYSSFKLSRIKLRELISVGEIIGVVRSSW